MISTFRLCNLKVSLKLDFSDQMILKPSSPATPLGPLHNIESIQRIQLLPLEGGSAGIAYLECFEKVGASIT